ncbi:LCP family protein [Clostridium psychrophilum]|uniref:LCP family protein n=1 Tax=Clostridium psychrophilum TaxID=132926 RepID=UPI001C0B582B|nr:LCP family protein [Clostridium psychrophilum]MBU3180988.1 LCP family protein [Clostridium psychrophilum]
MKKKKKVTKVVVSVIILGALVFGGVISYTFYQLSKVKTVKISGANSDLGISAAAAAKDASSGITNIALFGVDRRDKDEPGRSDSIMILSIDTKHKKIKMSSIMRDTYVKIKGHGQTKITHAYAYGGSQLAIRTINENFNLDIKDYVTVDFFDLEKLINAIGGVKVNVAQDEVTLINSYMNETAGIEKKAVTKLENPGTQNLNGLQAVAYSRIRYTTGGDFKRTERQRTVLTAMLTKIESLGDTQFPSVVSKLLPLTETSISSINILKLGTKVITTKSTTVVQERFPVDGYCWGKTIDKVWYLVCDMNTTIDQIHKFIYDDIKPVPTTPQI